MSLSTGVLAMDDLFSLSDEQVAAEAPLAARMRPRTLAEFVGQEHIVGPGTVLRAAVEGGAALQHDLLRAAGLRQDDAGAAHRRRDAAPAWCSSRRSAPGRRTCAPRSRARARRAPSTRRAPSSSSTRSTASTRRSRTRCCRRSRTASSRSSARPPRTRTSRSTRRSSPAASSTASSRWRPSWSSGSCTAALDDAERGLGGKGVALGDGGARLPRRHLARRRARRAQRARDRVALRARAASPGAPVTLTLDDLQRRGPEEPGRVRPRRRALRHHLGVHQEHARQRPGRRRVLPGLDDRRRRGPAFIARRMIVFASEDVGNADPQALQVAVAASRAVEFVGLPECRINLSQAADVPRARAQEQRRVQGRRRGARRRAAGGQPAAAAAPARAPTTGARRSSATARATSTRTATAAGWSSSTCPTELSGRRYYVPIRGVEQEMAARLEEDKRRAARGDPRHAAARSERHE